MQFSPKQMEQLKFALETGLTMSQMLILAKPHFDPYQMEQIGGDLRKSKNRADKSIC